MGTGKYMAEINGFDGAPAVRRADTVDGAAEDAGTATGTVADAAADAGAAAGTVINISTEPARIFKTGAEEYTATAEVDTAADFTSDPAVNLAAVPAKAEAEAVADAVSDEAPAVEAAVLEAGAVAAEAVEKLSAELIEELSADLADELEAELAAEAAAYAFENTDEQADPEPETDNGSEPDVDMPFEPNIPQPKGAGKMHADFVGDDRIKTRPKDEGKFDVKIPPLKIKSDSIRTAENKRMAIEHGVKTRGLETGGDAIEFMRFTDDNGASKDPGPAAPHVGAVGGRHMELSKSLNPGSLSISKTAADDLTMGKISVSDNELKQSLKYGFGTLGTAIIDEKTPDRGMGNTVTGGGWAGDRGLSGVGAHLGGMDDGGANFVGMDGGGAGGGGASVRGTNVGGTNIGGENGEGAYNGMMSAGLNPGDNGQTPHLHGKSQLDIEMHDVKNHVKQNNGVYTAKPFVNTEAHGDKRSINALQPGAIDGNAKQPDIFTGSGPDRKSAPFRGMDPSGVPAKTRSPYKPDMPLAKGMRFTPDLTDGRDEWGKRGKRDIRDGLDRHDTPSRSMLTAQITEAYLKTGKTDTPNRPDTSRTLKSREDPELMGMTAVFNKSDSARKLYSLNGNDKASAPMSANMELSGDKLSDNLLTMDKDIGKHQKNTGFKLSL
jgi:hypothetical protein